MWLLFGCQALNNSRRAGVVDNQHFYCVERCSLSFHLFGLNVFDVY